MAIQLKDTGESLRLESSLARGCHGCKIKKRGVNLRLETFIVLESADLKDVSICKSNARKHAHSQAHVHAHAHAHAQARGHTLTHMYAYACARPNTRAFVHKRKHT